MLFYFGPEMPFDMTIVSLPASSLDVLGLEYCLN